jgi:hypothetical protein
MSLCAMHKTLELCSVRCLHYKKKKSPPVLQAAEGEVTLLRLRVSLIPNPNTLYSVGAVYCVCEQCCSCGRIFSERTQHSRSCPVNLLLSSVARTRTLITVMVSLPAFCKWTKWMKRTSHTHETCHVSANTANQTEFNSCVLRQVLTRLKTK